MPSNFEDELLRLQKSREFPISIITCDVDGLKLANDALGHQHGDMLLQISAQTLQSCFRESDILARVGGDEFVALLPQTDFADGEKIVHRIRSMVQKYNQAHPGYLPLSLSMGWPLPPTRGLCWKRRTSWPMIACIRINCRTKIGSAP
ncbi:MAG: GGDEF domain-containing protein [Desulfovermiculus sp.]